MNNNCYNEYERRIRHIMCIFLSLETLIICIFIIADYFINWDYDVGFWVNTDTLTQLNIVSLCRILPDEFWIFCIVGIVCPLLSIRFKWFYRVYDGLHCLLGIIVFFGLLLETETVFVGLILSLILSARFCIYLFLIKG